MIWVNQILQGILLGGYYALIACGLSFMFGVMRIINLSHGVLTVLAAFSVLVIASHTGMNPFLALALVIPLMGLLGWLLQWLILERSLRAGELVPLLTTFGLAIVIENLLFEQFGADTRSLGPYIGSLAYDSLQVSSQIYIGYISIILFAVAVVILGGLQLFLKHTVLGRAIRATAEDIDTAELVGINSRSIYAWSVAIALATVAVGGTGLAVRATFAPYSGSEQLIFAFETVVIGGIGSLWGTLAGGIVLGVAQSLGVTIHTQGFLIAGHSVFLVILALRLFLPSLSVKGRLRALLIRRPA
jgi:branched-chain amino acid transport system permease protein